MLLFPSRAITVWTTILWIVILIFIILFALYLVWLFTRKREKGKAGHAEPAAPTGVVPKPAPAPRAEIAPEPAPTPEKVIPLAAAPPSVAADDLTRIEGIGPKVAQVLASIGITTFAALASADYTKIKRALVNARWPYMDPTGWMEQAKLAAEDRWEELAVLQEQLKGGRRVK